MAFYLRKFELGVVWVHLANLLACRCAQHFDNLHQLIDARVAGKNRLPQQQFGQHAARAPNICKNNDQESIINRLTVALMRYSLPIFVV